MNENLSRPRTAVIIAAAGRGERLGGNLPKAWRPLAGVTLIQRALWSFAPATLHRHGQRRAISWICLAVDAEWVEPARELTSSLPVPTVVVAGGTTRTHSVENALREVPDEIDVVAVHDAARPFWPVEHWDELVEESWKWDGAILAVPVSDTLKRAEIGGMVTVDRNDLWAAQTPQAFRAEMLRRAHAKAVETGVTATDDADLVRRVGGAIKIIYSTPRNIKITTPQDWELAEQLRGIPVTDSIRIGTGFDAHRLGGPGPLMLGGVRLAESGGLIGHSDGDALLHAICDALLGAAALGDIGVHFPPSDDKFRGCDSRELLRTTRDILQTNGFSPLQVDATVMAEKPRLSPYVDDMRLVIANDLGLDTGQVSVKATTTEGMGFVGREEGVAVHAVATIRRAIRGDV